ncbi:MAG TPA: YceI family protein [Thermoanaerobaculia bacterium]|nr:YceI family protein [Thermoanaerobaculia bacterium]
MKRFILSAVLAVVALPLAADTFKVDKAHSNVDYKVRHLVSNVTGKFTDFDGTIDMQPGKPGASSVEFTINAGSNDTGEADRDKHMRTADFFDVDKFPTISFKSTSIAPSKKKDLYNVTGNLTIRGVTKKVTIPVQFLGAAKDPWGNDKAGFSLTTTINRKDYGVNWNKALDNGGFLVGDDVEVTINLETQKQK